MYISHAYHVCISCVYHVYIVKADVLWSSLLVSKLANELGQGPMFLLHQQVPLIELTLNLPETLEAAPTLGSNRVSLQQG